MEGCGSGGPGGRRRGSQGRTGELKKIHCDLEHTCLQSRSVSSAYSWLRAKRRSGVWTERNRQRDVSMSADTPGWEGWRAMGWESDSEKS